MLRQNISAEFLLPMFFNSKNELTEKFVDSYLIDKIRNRREMELSLYLLFEGQPFVDMRARESYKINEKYYMIAYTIPEEYSEDYKLFLDGKYSKFSNKLKKKILQFYGPNSYQYKVITKNPERKAYLEKQLDEKFTEDMELLSSINIEEETFDEEKLKSCLLLD